MLTKRTLDILWLVLCGLTVGGALLGETAHGGIAVTLLIAVSMAIKGRLVVDHFMELKHANRKIRALMRAYFYVLPSVTVLVYLYGEQLAAVTSLR